LANPGQLAAQGADDWVMNYSSQSGCRARAVQVGEASSHGRSDGQGVLPAVMHTRHWFSPEEAGLSSCQQVLSDHLASAEQPMVLGGVSVSLRDHFAQRLSPRSKSAAVVCDYDSTASLTLPSGSWLRLLLSLSQDVFLQGVSAFHASTSGHFDNRMTVCPMWAGSNHFTVSHGLGLARLSSGRQVTSIGFDAPAVLNFPLIEKNLFEGVLTQVARSGEGRAAPALDAVLTPALGRLVQRMGLAMARGESTCLAQALVQAHVCTQDRPVPSAWGELAADTVLTKAREQLHQMVMQDESLAQDSSSSEQADEQAGCSLFLAVAEGLSRLQDEIRYGANHCQLPVAGIERAYLNALMRNVVCQSLGIEKPAEIAHFDVLLDVLRNRRNHGFNDYSHDPWLHSEMRRLSMHAAGSKQPLALQLDRLTQSVIDHADEAESQAGSVVFVLDESMPHRL
jgi:hypothetical protein